MYLSDIQRIQTVERYITRQKRFIESHVKSLGLRHHTVDFNVYGFIIRADVLDNRFCIELHGNEWFGLFHCLEKYPCKCTKEKLLQGIYFWLEQFAFHHLADDRAAADAAFRLFLCSHPHSNLILLSL